MSNAERGLVTLTNIEDWSQNTVINRFNTMVNNINNMIKKNGPIYSTWIYFQLGKNEPVIFNTSSTDKDRNIIANLTMEKGNSSVANTFTLTVNFDPFNFGQETQSKVELLDEYVAQAMYVDWKSDDEDTKLRGIIQYGYNSTNNGDDKLVTPKYEFLLSKADSEIKYSSGIGTYTFEGVSTVAAGSDYEATFTEIKGWKPLDIVIWTLFYYFGDSQHIPNGLASDSKPSEMASKYKYRIDVPQWLVDDQQEEIDVQASKGSVWQYCLDILTKYPLTKSNKESGLYDKLDDMNADERPSYYMYITEQSDCKTIHITHNTPKESEKNDKVDYVFTWSKQSENIMLDWKPEASLYMYLITKFKYLSTKENVDENKIREQEDANNGVVETWEDKMSRLGQESLLEMYNATMTTLGIPADAPITAEVKVIPTVLESVSRTAGIYIIKSATDTISTDGTYTTQFKLFRIRGLNEADAVSAKEIASNQTDETKEETKTVYTGLYTTEEVPVSQTTNKTYNRKVQPSAVSQLSNKVQLVKASDIQNKVLKVVP